MELFCTLKFAVSKQEKFKDYPWVETPVNSALGHINVTKVISEMKRLVEAKAYRKKNQADVHDPLFF